MVLLLLCLRRRRGDVILSCLAFTATVIVIQFFTRSALQQATHVSRSSVSVTSADAEGVETLLVPVSRLVEPSLPSRAWFSGDPSCAHLLTQFARPGSLPDARLASFPRSGNTWTRYLLEAATGFVTCGPTFDSEAAEEPPYGALPAVADVIAFKKRSLTTSAEIRAAGFIAEHVSPLTRTCIIAKTHVIPPAWRRVDGVHDESAIVQDSIASNTSSNVSSSEYPLPAILLVRDPFRAIIAVRHLLTSNDMMIQNNHTADPDLFSGSDWRQFVEQNSRYWFDMVDEWAEGPQHTLLVSYERLVAEPAAQLRRMLRFLGVTPSPERLRCTLRHKEGPFKNKQHPVVPTEEVFDADMRRLVWFRIRLLDKTLVNRGYQRLNLKDFAFFSGY